VRVAFDAWSAGHVAPSLHDVPVVASQSKVKAEAVSARLKGELIHPNRTSVLTGIRFSPDGKRLLAGDYPGGVAVVWDVASGKQLTVVETGYGSRNSLEYLFVTPDWRSLFVARRGKRHYDQVEEKGKRMLRWTFDGDVRVWDLDTGQLQRTYQHQPPRSLLGGMLLSPDGRTFVTSEELPGTYERQAPRAGSLWEAKTGQHRPLPPDVDPQGRYAPDGRRLAVTVADGAGYSRAVKLFDVATGREELAVAIKENYVWARVAAFSPDGRIMAGTYQRFEAAKSWDRFQSSFKWWDTATGREIASFGGDSTDSFGRPCFSANGQTLAATSWRGERAKLLLFNVTRKQLTGTLVVGEQPKGERFLLIPPVFRPDGKQLALLSQVVPDAQGGGEPDAQDVAQAHVLLIDVATGTIQEILAVPPGFPRSACYSPDGRTLATGGLGRVLLWDLSEQ
jgi:WD40 repeat protein